MTEQNSNSFLGVECGGTRTVAISQGVDSSTLLRKEFGPANLRLTSDKDLLRHFGQIAIAFPQPVAIAVGMAGMRSQADHARVRLILEKVWGNIPCHTSHDLETAISAVPAAEWGKSNAQIIVLSGTGSCCYAKASNGKTAKVGGWGHLIGDKGSGYEIGLRSLKAVVYHLDRNERWTSLGQRLLRRLHLNAPEDLIGWSLSAAKSDIAALAIEVFGAFAENDPIAKDILEGAASSLARDAVCCAKRLVPSGTKVSFHLSGSILTRQPRFAATVARNIRKEWPNSTSKVLKHEAALGALALAKQALGMKAKFKGTNKARRVMKSTPWEPSSLRSLLKSPTEQRNPRSVKFAEMRIPSAIKLMLYEDRKLADAVLSESRNISKTIEYIIRSFKRGGRLIYVGAGTSGRLGVLDASECPPTFRVSPQMVQGIIAGGQKAVFEAVEGAEDSTLQGLQAIQFRNVDSKDVVVGIAASGRTPFVWGALMEARKRKAKTVLVCMNPFLDVSNATRPDIIIAPNVGPEVLTGSTRLKSGTATKLILNMFTTIAMAKIGKVVSNLMIDLNPSNVKLRDRAARIVSELTSLGYEESIQLLERNKWVIKDALNQFHRPKAGSLRGSPIKTTLRQ